jgi:hydrogenase expression/formation protein HypE
MKEREDKIMLSHGSGGQMMHKLIEDLFITHFNNPILSQQTDAALLSIDASEIAFTTDSFVIDPLFFPGGDIGKLSVCGTVNDLSVTGARPLYISVSMIIEEGFGMKDLETIVASIAKESKKAGVQIVTGDTKVVNKGKCDKLFINTAGIGKLRTQDRDISRALNILPGDLIIINGTIGDHGMAILNARESFHFKTTVQSDCASLSHLIRKLLDNTTVKFMRDPTRGGVASVLNELAGKIKFGIEIDESVLPIDPGVRAMCEVLGFDPLHIANEGKVIIVASPQDGLKILELLKDDELGRNCAIIGRIVSDYPGKVVLKNETGGLRIIDMISGDQLPRIC